MRTFIMLILPVFFVITLANAQEEKEKDKRPVRAPFESALLLDGQTIIVPTKNTLEFDIQHRFGTMKNKGKDLFGIYAPSNIRLGLTFTPIENLAIGFGSTKDDMLQDFSIKYAILKQTRSWSIPLSLTYFGNAVVDTGEDDRYDRNVQRWSYHHELMIATKINSKLSIQLTPSYSHYNGVDTLYTNDMLAVSLAGRYKLTPQMSIIAGYSLQLQDHDAPDFDLQPNLCFGIEISTSSHAFQIFAGNFSALVPQRNLMYNENSFGDGEILVGFNITRLWNF